MPIVQRLKAGEVYQVESGALIQVLSGGSIQILGKMDVTGTTFIGDAVLNDVSLINLTAIESATINHLTLDEPEYVDIDFPILIRTTGTGIPTLEVINGDITMPQWQVNDYNVCESQEFIHGWKEGSVCSWHIHLTTNGLEAVAKYVKFELQYGFNDGHNTPWQWQTAITTADIAIPANTPDQTMLIMSLGTFTPADAKIGGHVIARLKRVTATGAAPTNNPWIAMLQMHVLCDTVGSRGIGTK